MLKVFSKGLKCIWSYRYYRSPHKTYTFKPDRIVARKKEVGKKYHTNRTKEGVWNWHLLYQNWGQISFPEQNVVGLSNTLSSVGPMLRDNWWAQNGLHVLLCILLLWVGVMSFLFCFVSFFIFIFYERERMWSCVGREKGRWRWSWGLGQKERIW